MQFPFVAALLCVASLFVAPAKAATLQIDSFSANATTVTAGALVEFNAVFSVSTLGENFSGVGPEPAPAEGNQTWEKSFSSGQNETLFEVWLAAEGQSYAVDLSALPPGSSYAGEWKFSILFPSAGRFETTLLSGWTSGMNVYFNAEVGERQCTTIDVGGSSQLSCTPWLFQQANYSDAYSLEGQFAPQTVVIDVIASSIPEPQPLAQWAVGMAGLLVLCLARRRLGPPMS